MVSPELLTRIQAAAFHEGDFTLASGETLREYFDEYVLAADPVLLRDVARALAQKLPSRVEGLVAMALGGVPLAVAMSSLTGLHTTFFRPTRKAYGTCRQIEAAPAQGTRVVVVDDVVRSGSQVLHAAECLHRIDVTVVGAVCVLDRGVGGNERLSAAGIPLKALLGPGMLVDRVPKGA
ncbi:orotate phosphoribosyltransferase [Nocardia camponoti]|uniref:Orotate phosphoribosyltransferase n=2 Tax=Nocardia camponoti TaxID=1616106 RepID=A0A917V6F8_9NOCA|nr:orotate phosphoribosyltransferase [Nocardia camponoti]